MLRGSDRRAGRLNRRGTFYCTGVPARERRPLVIGIVDGFEPNAVFSWSRTEHRPSAGEASCHGASCAASSASPVDHIPHDVGSADLTHSGRLADPGCGLRLAVASSPGHRSERRNDRAVLAWSPTFETYDPRIDARPASGQRVGARAPFGLQANRRLFDRTSRATEVPVDTVEQPLSTIRMVIDRIDATLRAVLAGARRGPTARESDQSGRRYRASRWSPSGLMGDVCRLSGRRASGSQRSASFRLSITTSFRSPSTATRSPMASSTTHTAARADRPL